MNFFRNLISQKLIGLDIGCHSLKAIEITSDNPPALLAYKRMRLFPNTIAVNGAIASELNLKMAIKKLFNTKVFSSREVSVNLLNFMGTTQKIKVPDNFEKLSKAQILQLVPGGESYLASEITLDHEILNFSQEKNKKEQSREALIVLAKKMRVQKLQTLLSDCGIDSLVVDHPAIATGNSFWFNYPTLVADAQGAYLILDLGAGSTKIVVCEHGQVVYTDEIEFAGNHCTRMLSEKLALTEEEAESIKCTEAQHPKVAPLLRNFTESLCGQIAEAVSPKFRTGPALPIKSIFTCGGGSMLEGLKETLSAKFGLPVHPLNPLKHVVGTGEKVGLKLLRDAADFGTVAVGLAFRQPGDKKKAVRKAVLR